MKKNFIILTFLLFIFLGCATKEGGLKENINAKLMVNYVNYFNLVADKVINDFESDLKLSVEQTEILYLTKSELLAKIPDIRQMVFGFQMKMIEKLSKEKVEYKDSLETAMTLDFYEKIFKPVLVKRIVELHKTLSVKQKEKLVKYLDGGKIMTFPSISIPNASYFSNKAINLILDIKLTVPQLLDALSYSNEIKKLGYEKRIEFFKESKTLKNDIKQLILKDSLAEKDIDDLFNKYLKMFETLKTKTLELITDFVNDLSGEQKKVLSDFISSFNSI